MSGPPKILKSKEEMPAMGEPGVRKSVEKKRPEERLRMFGHQANDGQIQRALAMEGSLRFAGSRLSFRCWEEHLNPAVEASGFPKRDGE